MTSREALREAYNKNKRNNPIIIKIDVAVPEATTINLREVQMTIIFNMKRTGNNIMNADSTNT